MKRRILSFLLALCMVLTLSPITVYAAPDSAETPDLVGMQARAEQTNPLYDEDRQKTPSLYDPPKLFSTLNSAESADLRSGNDNSLLTLINGLEQRQPTISVLWKISASEISTSDDLEALLLAVFAVAMSHTGAPTQGDYLLWQYAGMSCHAEVFDERSGNYFLRLTYNVQYYTTAEQEAAVTAKLDEVMASFGFTEETGDYDKIKTIYDYICANVTYDYANLNDDNYTLKHTAYAALIDGTAVCQGYALLLYRMLLSAGIDNRIISGTANGGGHGWNIVALNNFYYNADSTWDAGQTEYSYFLKCPDNFTDHVRDAEFDTAEFHAYYPMGAADYVPGGSSILASGTCGEDVNWVLGSDGILTVSGTGAMDDYAKAEDAPWYDYRDYVLGVVVEEGVQHVGNYAFAKYPRLCAVSVASGSVGKLAFYNCDALLAVDLLEGVEDVGQQAFNECSTLLAVACAAKSLGSQAFASCDALAAVELMEGVTNIGSQAFMNCTSLTTVSFPTTMQAVELHAFFGCSAMDGVYITDLAAWCGTWFGSAEANPLSQSSAVLYLNEAPIIDLVIPDGVTAIEANTFPCRTITSLTIPEGVEYIDHHAFYQSGITEVRFPDSITWIGGGAFEGSDLISVTLGDGITTLPDSIFKDCRQLQTVSFNNTLQQIDGFAFFNCTKLQSIVLPSTVSRVGIYSLSQCYAMESITFTGNAPTFEIACFTSTPALIYYPCNNETWAEAIQSGNYDCSNWAKKHGEAQDVGTLAPTCTEPGYTGGLECSVCGEILSGQQQLDPLGHSFTQYISNNDATAEADGTKTAVCDRDDCGEVSTITDEGSQMVSLEITTPPAKTEYLAGREELDVTGAIATVTRANGQTFTVEITNDMVTGFDNTAPGKQTLTVSCLGLSAPLRVVIRGAVVVFQMDDGTEISRAEYPFGAEVTIPADPVKPSDETYTYTFTGWDKPVTTADADAIYTATFVSSYIDYTIVFQYDDGTIIAQQTLHYGDEVTIPAEPEKPEGTEETDIFRGWDKAVSPTCTGSVTYTAVFGPEVLPGDFTGDDLVTDDDAIYLLWHTLFPERYPLQGNGDLTGDGLVTDDDAIYLLWHTLFPERYPLTTTIQKRGKEK